MKLRIVFMGTPEFAVPSLKILLENDYEVVGVITATDKYGGRGGKRLIESAVKKFAVANDIKVLQPRNLKNPEFQEELRSLNANLQIVVAFRMLPHAVWAMPEFGTFNLHGSLLPKYRGAAPINWAVIEGEKETGVTSFFLKQEIDTGNIVFQERLPIGENDTAGDVHDRMMHLGAEVVLKTVQAIEEEKIETKIQDDSLATKAPKIFTEICQIDFNQRAAKVHNFIRGLSPYPAAWTTFEGSRLKILKTSIELEMHGLAIGTILSDNKNYIKIACLDGFICLHELQLQGRKRMESKMFLNGFNFEENSHVVYVTKDI